MYKGKSIITIDEIKQPKSNPLVNGKYFQMRGISHFNSANSFTKLLDTSIKYKPSFHDIIAIPTTEKKNEPANKRKRMKTNKTIIESNRVSYLNKNKKSNRIKVALLSLCLFNIITLKKSLFFCFIHQPTKKLLFHGPVSG